MNQLSNSFSGLVHNGIIILRRLVDSTSRNMGIVFGGHLIRQALGIISSALLARGLGPDGLSVFSVVGATMMIAGGVADFGLSNSAVRLISGDLTAEPERAKQTARLYSQYKVVGAFLVVFLIVIFSRPLGRVLNLPEQTGSLFLRLAGIGLFTVALGRLSSTILQAMKRFRSMVVAHLANISLTILLFGFLYTTNRLNITSALLVGAITAFVAATLAFFLWPLEWRRALTIEVKKILRGDSRLLNYSKWLGISAILSILFNRMDLILLNYFLPPASVGFYALGLNLVLKIGIINQTVHTVLFPTVSAMSGNDDYERYLRKSMKRNLIMILGIIVVLPLARPFILFVYTDIFAPSVWVFYSLISVILLDLLSIPFLLLAFPMDLLRLIVLSDIISLVVLVLVSVWLIPIIGLFGPVVGKFSATLIRAVLLGGGILQRLRGANF